MARRVFFSFQYVDVQRVMVVRNSNVVALNQGVGFIDKAEFERVEREGDSAIKRWIDKQLEGNSVTVVLVGGSTDKSKWVKYEIEASKNRGNGLLTVDISQISDLKGNTTTYCGLTVPSYKHYQWFKGEGSKNLGTWVEEAAKAAGR
ncbi:TIR domain-containing protein [Xanthomonas nasturtii]|uniref:TIR domain-containing protein n=1 Tax=Xanthomonas nasturtii TaxID=1843581 RepID=UPI002012EEDB|nr:TIR domain-containing protein [Xanthomonas nasturtii]MCL1534498.1 TIR domain-containing protein [Xanthomonas nasturtii]